MKSVSLVVFGLGLMIALGASLLAPGAEAASPKQISLPVKACLGSLTALPCNNRTRVSFLLGEDGAIWYTSTNSSGQAPLPLGPIAPTGNRNNPFDQNVAKGAPQPGCDGTTAKCNGFVDASGLAAACGTTGDTCSGIYARTRGPGMFIESPVAEQSLGLSGGNALAFLAGITTIIATGADRNFWYTIFDSLNEATTTGMCSSAGNCPGKDPFFAAAEDQSTTLNPGQNTDGNGFVNQASLLGQCVALGRTCIGIWVRFP